MYRVIRVALVMSLLALSPASAFASKRGAHRHGSSHAKGGRRSSGFSSKPARVKTPKAETRHRATATAHMKRSTAAKHAFEVQSGYPHGRPGYVVDHVVPLACGGADAPGNMQWQTIEAAKAKDRVERLGCP